MIELKENIKKELEKLETMINRNSKKDTIEKQKQKVEELLEEFIKDL